MTVSGAQALGSHFVMLIRLKLLKAFNCSTGPKAFLRRLFAKRLESFSRSRANHCDTAHYVAIRHEGELDGWMAATSSS